LNNSFNPDNKYSGRASKNLKPTSKGAGNHNHSMQQLPKAPPNKFSMSNLNGLSKEQIGKHI
jgi:hypothetical protein